VSICATAVHQRCKCENVKGAFLSAPPVTKRIATSAINTYTTPVFVNGTVEMLHCGLEASVTITCGETCTCLGRNLEVRYLSKQFGMRGKIKTEEKRKQYDVKEQISILCSYCHDTQLVIKVSHLILR